MKNIIEQAKRPEEDPTSPHEGLFHLLHRCVHGHDTDIESICHYQDVFGHSCEEDHEKAANSEYRDTFYRLYDEAYGVMATINFDRKHGAYARNLREKIECLECDLEDARDEEDCLRKSVQSTEKNLQDAEKTISELRNELQMSKDDVKRHIEVIFEMEKKIVYLKARMFDFMEQMEESK